MYIKEKIQSNKVNAPILFIGVGGIGSKIVKGVADRAINDDTSNIRFVVMDTDVNDLLTVNKGAEIVAIQTSSTSSVESYLKNDTRMMNVNADFIHTYCENADEIIAIIHQNAQAVSQSEVAQSSAQVIVNFDADEIRNLIAEMEVVSEKLGEILWNIK